MDATTRSHNRVAIGAGSADSIVIGTLSGQRYTASTGSGDRAITATLGR